MSLRPRQGHLRSGTALRREDLLELPLGDTFSPESRTVGDSTSPATQEPPGTNSAALWDGCWEGTGSQAAESPWKRRSDPTAHQPGTLPTDLPSQRVRERALWRQVIGL